jgi:hypothetical protein
MSFDDRMSIRFAAFVLASMAFWLAVEAWAALRRILGHEDCSHDHS